jgi:hypothetical protein
MVRVRLTGLEKLISRYPRLVRRLVNAEGIDLALGKKYPG